MASEQSPLLSRDSAAGNDDAERKATRASRVREIGLFVWALLATAGFIVAAVWIQHGQQTHPGHHHPPPPPPPHGPPGHHHPPPPPPPHHPHGKRNLVFMVSDGMGPASLSLTRSFRQHVEGLPLSDTLTLDKHFWGSSRTRSSSSLVTDSAAGATAFSCGRKTYNGAISVLPSYDPCGTVLQAAKRAGYMTGLTVTTDVVDATPACFGSNVLLRQMEDDIALQEVGEGVLGRSVDLILGGGRCFFLPNTTDGGCRADDIDVIKLAQEKHGWHYAGDRAAFDSLKGGDDAQLPLLGLFARTDIPFELDRRNMSDVYPSLSEMATTALRTLEKATADSDKGFFLMIEGSRIDHAGHINDPAAQVHEVLEYDKTFKAVLDFIDSTDTETVLVATSDHETGGLATALQEPGHLPVYNWYPDVLASATASAEHLAIKLAQHVAALGAAPSKKKLAAWINDELVVPGLGIKDATLAELAQLADSPDQALVLFSAMVSLRAHIGWSTHGHSAVDVNVYSSGGPPAESIRGNVENTDIGRFLADFLDVDVDAITKELQEKTKKPDVAALGLGATGLEVLPHAIAGVV
jgi:alkaline phosphatase